MHTCVSFLYRITLKMASFTSTSARLLTILTASDGVPGSYFEQEPSNYTVEQLKRWLKCRGLKQSGKRCDLIKRITDCISSGNHRTLDVSIDEGKWFAAKVIRENNEAGKCGQFQNSRDVPMAPLAGWRPFQSQDIPSLFNYGHIYYYALESIKTIIRDETQNDEEDQGLGYMTDKPLKNARKYVDSGFVHETMDTKSDEHYFLRAHVWPSMRTDLPHNVLVILSNTSGAVIHASCEPCKVSALGRCSHVVAVLLYLLDHVQENGPTVTVPCTSQPCSWNKGKKRSKNPQRLSSADYPSKMAKSEIKVIDFDPRPKNNRHVNHVHVNGLLRDLQNISANNEDVSMWETQLEMTYDNYDIDLHDEQTLKEKTQTLIENLKPMFLTEIPNTRDQSASEEWFKQKFWRLTASNCLTACRIGKLIKQEGLNAEVRAYNFIYSSVWKMENNSFQTTWMRYGIESEPKAVEKYEAQTKSKVCQTGLWVNPKFPFLGCSPDGLIDEDGLIEIKSLKLFKDNTIDQIVSGQASTKDVLNRQCFSIKDGKCTLKLNHGYYYQIQMQLLITERHFCDFVLYAQEGPVSIERIFRNDDIITEILSDLTAFWVRVIGPELFEMRVPRRLHPFILSDEKNSSEGPVNTDGAYTQDELDIADILACSLVPPPTTTTTTTQSINNLVIIPWGGETSNGIRLLNTCPLDNWLMIFQALVKSNRINLADLTETGHIISAALQMIEHNQFAEAKIAVLTTPPKIISNCINFYGNEDEYFIKLLRPYMCSEVTTKCSLDTCPCPQHTYTSFTANLGYPPELSNNIFLDTLDSWLHPEISQCRRRFDYKPPYHVPCIEDVILDDNGHAQPSWHCAGERECLTGRSLINLKNFFILSVDLLSRGGMLTLSQVPSSIILQEKTYKFYGATLWNGGHYIGMFNFNSGWILYDGLKEMSNKNSGISFSHTVFDEPNGYYLSYLIFCI